MASVLADPPQVKVAESRILSSVKSGFSYFQDGDILVAKITPCFENGKIAQARIKFRHGFGSTEFHVVRPKNDQLDGRYLLHFIRQNYIRRKGERRMTGSAGQRRVPKAFLESLEIYLPPIAEQRRIAAILDKAEELRELRRQALRELDAIAQSTFIEIFGDPISNSKGWPIVTIRKLLKSASYGTSAKAGAKGEFPILRMNNLTYKGGMDFSDLKFIDLKPNEIERYTVREGDVLFNRTNRADLVGKTAIYRKKEHMAYAGYLVRLRVDKENHPEFLAAFLNSKYAKRMLRGMCKSIIGMANINANEIQNMSIFRPPLQLQKEFADRIESIEQLKTTHRESLAQLNALFASLQHRAFRGEL